MTTKKEKDQLGQILLFLRAMSKKKTKTQSKKKNKPS